MEILKMILTAIFFLDCIVLTVIVLMQEGKQQGLGVIAESCRYVLGKEQRTFYGGRLGRRPGFLGALFFVLALVLNMKFW
ncbi:MAG: preprotein translocase subunit SecG [Blautia sp.]